MSIPIVDGTTYTLTLTFKAIKGGTQFDDIALIDRNELPPEVIGRFLIHLGNKTLSGASKGKPIQ